jgi:hypothetical protein
MLKAVVAGVAGPGTTPADGHVVGVVSSWCSDGEATTCTVVRLVPATSRPVPRGGEQEVPFPMGEPVSVADGVDGLGGLAEQDRGWRR